MAGKENTMKTFTQQQAEQIAIDLNCLEALEMGAKYLARQLNDYEGEITYSTLRCIYESMGSEE